MKAEFLGILIYVVLALASVALIVLIVQIVSDWRRPNPTARVTQPVVTYMALIFSSATITLWVVTKFLSDDVHFREDRMADRVCVNHRGAQTIRAYEMDRGSLSAFAGARHMGFYCKDGAVIDVLRKSLDEYTVIASAR